MIKNYSAKHLIITVTHHYLSAIEMFLNNLLPILEHRQDLEMVVIDSGSEKEIVDYLKTIKLHNVEVIFHKENIGKAKAVNRFFKEMVSRDDLPSTIISMDPDIVFSEIDLNYLIEATENLNKIGMLSMRFVKEGFPLEQNIWFPPIMKKGINNKKYKLRVPFLCNVAGAIFVVKAERLIDPLNFIFYPIKYETAYGPDDAMLSDALRKAGYTNAYLEGTEALHLRVADKKSKELIEYEEKRLGIVSGEP
jgi:GT2 family glycosyltransferase